MAVTTYTKTGAKATTAVKLDKAIFDVQAKNHELVKAAYDTYLANGRPNLAVAKTRGQVRGSTRKHHQQKGTGRARAGAVSNPLWRSGGATFGPTGEENYTKRLNTKAKRLALRQALSMKAGNVKVIEAFECKDGKTATATKLLGKIEAKGSILMIVDSKDTQLELATRNLSNVKLASGNYLNVYDIINADCIVVTKPALDVINAWLGKEAK
jgi:large subunit ribosomal protein L4